MKKTFLYTALWLMGIMGTLSIWVASADTGCWSTYWWTVPTSTYSTWIVYWCDGDIPIITIYWKNWDNKDVWITIKAMNEWATAISFSTNNTDSYWSLYQWWNNYWFPSAAVTDTFNISDTFASAEWYAPWTYNSWTWHYKDGSSWPEDYWDTSNNRNLWWWSGDNWPSDNGIYNWAFRWFNTWDFLVTSPLDRKAMCPEWYHIPSEWEWYALLYLWWNNYKEWLFNDRNISPYSQNIYLDWSWVEFSRDMQIPIAGYRSQKGWRYTNNGYYWSSTSRSNIKLSATFSIEDGRLRISASDYRATGRSVRCFKNSYVKLAPSTFTLTFTGSGQGSISTWSIEAEEWAYISLDDGAGTVTISWTVVATGIANEWYVFSWWLTDCGDTVTKACNFTGEFKPITYNVQFTWTDVSWTMLNQEFTYDVTWSLTANAFTKTGYIFSGWTYWTTGYADGQEVSNLTATDGATVTLTAQWTPITYTISFSWNADDATWTQALINAEYDSGDIAPDNSFTLTGYTFTGWNTESDGSGTWYTTWAELKNLTTTSGANVELYAQWEVNVHKLNFVVDWTTIQSGDVAYAAAISAPAEPKKDCNSFAGWTSSVEWLTTTGTMPDSDVTFTANWNYTCSRSSWGGARSVSKSDDKQTDKNGTNTEKENNTPIDSSADASEWQDQWKTYSEEFQNAYDFAYKNWITTMQTAKEANMEGPLTRIAMAKMLSNYAINVLWKKPANKVVPKFPDVDGKLNEDYGWAVDLAYQLWIMWIWIEKFRPYDLVPRSEFGTALSRMLYKIADWKDKYYSTHLAKLMEEKIITNDDPNMKELRGYVMIMLMRSAENK